MPKKIVIGDEQLNIKEFDIDAMAPNPSIVIIAKRASGKSWVVRSIMKRFKNVPGGIVISPTDEMHPFYSTFFPDLYVHYSYKSDLMERLLGRQTAMLKKAKEKLLEGKKVDPRAFLIMDDCLADNKWKNDMAIRKILMNGRHYAIMYILTMQSPVGIPPNLRNNFDYIFILAESFASEQKKIFDHYAGMFGNFKAFQKAFKVITEDYGCLVINNRGKKDKFEDMVYYFKAQKESFDIMGNDQFNGYHDNNYNEKWGEKQHRAGAPDAFINRKGNGIQINKIPKFNGYGYGHGYGN